MSQEDGPPEQDDPRTIRDLFNRSPHPYHRPRFESSEKLALNRSSRPNALRLKDARSRTLPVLSDRASIRTNTSPSDSGTEADDEKTLLKALTAPPLRPRKGLRGTQAENGSISPSLTLSGHEEQSGGLLAGYAVFNRKERKVNKGHVPQQLRSSRRQGFEVTRRLFEVIIFGGVCLVSLSRLDRQGIAAFTYHALTIGAIYASYVPILVFRLVRSRRQGDSWLIIPFPASTDPAPLIYPVFLPLLVSFSVGSQTKDVLVNCVLSLCAIPRQAILLQDYHVQWVLTTIPLLFQSVYAGAEISDPVTEELTLLFPLHFALMQTLYFLTTSSLLTTELQLLSVAFINLLGVPKTPQASILKALLWVGGLAMLVSCRHVLQLSVELARIPTWRLRRVQWNHRSRSTVFCALDDTLGGFLSRRIFRSPVSSDSDSTSDDQRRSLVRASPRRRASRNKALPTNATTLDDLAYAQHSPAYAEDRQFFSPGLRQRRHTLPGSLSNLPDIPTITRTATDALSSAKTRTRLIIRLTLPQATVLKWLYASFTYLMTILIIAIPVRLYVQYFALGGKEPIGWALGYLFGDYQPFRMQVVLWNLDSWACLPSRDLPISIGLAERTRQIVIGAANSRLLISAHCLACIAVGLAIVIHLSNVVEVDTRRKVFHGMMVLMFLPTIFIDPTFIALAFTLILAIFLLLDLFRASQLPPLSRPLTYFLAPYVDGRDHKGPVIISHIFLLVGCAIPLWLSLAAVDRTGEGAVEGWELPTRGISMVSGVICVGMGDAAASLIGRRFGRRRWPWSGGKSLEGSAAFALAVFAGLALSRLLLLLGEWPGDSGDTWMESSLKMFMAAMGSSLTEAVLTGGNDNVVVPIILWLLTKGLAI